MAKEKNKNLIKLGKNIRKIRHHLGISQEELALKANIDRSYIGGIERGERNISFLTLLKLSKHLNCSLINLVEAIYHE